MATNNDNWHLLMPNHEKLNYVFGCPSIKGVEGGEGKNTICCF